MGENRVYLSRCLSKALRARARALHYLRHSGRAGPPRLPAGRTVYLRRIVGPRLRRGPRTPLHAAQLDPCHLLDVVEDAISG